MLKANDTSRARRHILFGNDERRLAMFRRFRSRGPATGGSHVANAGFMVSASARGQGIGRAMAEHCLSEARRLGFRAMQFNYVISTNTAAIHLWEDLGFEIVGTLPSAFRHPDKGYVDVYVMYRSLLD